MELENKNIYNEIQPLDIVIDKSKKVPIKTEETKRLIIRAMPVKFPVMIEQQPSENITIVFKP